MKHVRKTLRPGMNVDLSGQYRLYKADGTSARREVTLVKDEHAPPTPKKHMFLRLVDKTKHKK